MKIIDLHTHCNCGLKNDYPETEIHKRSFEFVTADYAKFGVVAGGFSCYFALHGTDENIREQRTSL